MTPLTTKLIKNGFIEKTTIEMFEKMGLVENGATTLVHENAAKEATRETLYKVVSDLEEIIEKDYHIRETYLDLERIRWPATINIKKTKAEEPLVKGIAASVDRMGRYYIRMADSKLSWFVVGYLIFKDTPLGVMEETITNVQTLYIGSKPACIQITAIPVE